jgi:hypothetical protein
MKKFLFLILCAAMITVKVKGQVMSPQLAYFNGIGSIFYPYGYYQGGIIQGVANGDGVFYYGNGVIFRGNFTNGLPNGPGLIIVPYRGYVTGCWYNGQYVGQCQQTSNPFTDDDTVSSTVDDVQSKQPQNDTYATVAKNNYRITQIDPNTELGQSMLGSYTPNQ